MQKSPILSVLYSSTIGRMLRNFSVFHDERDNFRILDNLRMTVKPVMTNIKFALGFDISLSKCLIFFNLDWHSFISYRLRKSPALNIKTPLPFETLKIVPVTICDYIGTGPPSLRRCVVRTMSAHDVIKGLDLKEMNRQLLKIDIQRCCYSKLAIVS
jgi:hypothetical protein